MRSSAKRTLFMFGAVIAAITAFVILADTGLPQRANFTGDLSANSRPVAPELGAFAPDFELQSAEGESIRLSDLQGQPVIVNFWATWCGPCMVEMPILQSLYDNHRDQGVRILAVNMGETKQVVREWQSTYRLTYDLLIDESQSVSTLYRLRGQPSTFVISPEGVISDIFFGPVNEVTLRAVLG